MQQGGWCMRSARLAGCTEPDLVRCFQIALASKLIKGTFTPDRFSVVLSQVSTLNVLI